MHSQTKKERVLKENVGPVVQSVRIHACHAWGREFESRPDRKSSPKRGLFLYPIETVLYNDCFLRYVTSSIMGLTGFDSKDNGFVSMQAHTSEASKTDVKQ